MGSSPRPRSTAGARLSRRNRIFSVPVNTVDDVLADPQTDAAGAIVEVTELGGTIPEVREPGPLPRHPVALSRRAPPPGETPTTSWPSGPGSPPHGRVQDHQHIEQCKRTRVKNGTVRGTFLIDALGASVGCHVREGPCPGANASAPWFDASIAASCRRRCSIFPISVSGKSSTRSNASGHRSVPTRALVVVGQCRQIHLLAGDAAAQTPSPKRSSGTPAAATRSSDGCLVSASSTSPGAMFNPPRMISSLRRSGIPARRDRRSMA